MIRKIRAEAINQQNSDNLLLSSSPSSSHLKNDTLFKESIEWLQLERSSNKLNSNIILLLGYKSGISLWLIDTNGIANGLLNIKDINISHARLIQANKLVLVKNKQNVEFYDMTNGNQIQGSQISFGPNEFITDLKSNERLILFKINTNKWIAYDLASFKCKFTIQSMVDNMVLALSTRWLAFNDCNFYNIYSSQGGLSQDTAEELKSYTSTMIQTAKILKKKIQSTLQHQQHSLDDQQQPQQQDGIVTIIDTITYNNGQNPYEQDDFNGLKWIVAHFKAHSNSKIHLLEFSPNGTLLVTCDTNGCYFNVFKIFYSTHHRTHVKHLYILYRGDTTCKASNICFSYDTRYVCVSTNHGTTHVFPINSYGGLVNARTHLKSYLANRLSKHNRTAGFNQSDVNESNTQNPKLKSLKEPFMINSLAQIKSNNNIIESLASLSFAQHENNTQVASVFGETRGHLSVEEAQDANKSNLVEYKLDVHASQMGPLTKPVTNDSPIQLKVLAKAQWPLQRFIRDSSTSPISFKSLLDLKNTSNNNHQQQHIHQSSIGLNEWIKLVESKTHVEPHRRLFMGPQFIFKTIQSIDYNTNEQQTTTSSAILNESIENSSVTNTDLLIQSEPISIKFSNHRHRAIEHLHSQPTFIDIVGPGSYQEDMPYFGCSGTSIATAAKSNDSFKLDSMLIESLANAMQDEFIINNKTAPIEIAPLLTLSDPTLRNATKNKINFISSSSNSSGGGGGGGCSSGVGDLLVDYSNSNSSTATTCSNNSISNTMNANDYSFDNIQFNDDN